MKNIGSILGWCLVRGIKTFGNAASFVVRQFVDVKPGKVVCWAHNYKQYGCNPRYITEYLLRHYPDMEIVWVFRSGVDTSSVPQGVKCVRFKSLDYLKAINSAEFLLSNLRTDPWHAYWHKRPGQKYLMLWHAGVALKKIERDAEANLGFSYLQKAKRDSKAADLMISGCKMQTMLLKEKFWYDGEILEAGIPRNDIFFDSSRHAEIRQRVLNKYGINQSNKVVLYAPTFRRNGNLDSYRLDWQSLLPHLRNMLGGDVSIMLRLHPNLIGKVDRSSLLCHDAVTDVTLYDDIHELLCIADLLITDYSSSMFDYSLQKRPCLLYTCDADSYDRGYYFSLDELPYPVAYNHAQLVEAIKNFDQSDYNRRLNEFFDHRIGNLERGEAAKSLALWMRSHTLK